MSEAVISITHERTGSLRMTKLAVVGFGILLTLFGTGYHCCQPVCDAYGDLINEFG